MLTFPKMDTIEFRCHFHCTMFKDMSKCNINTVEGKVKFSYWFKQRIDPNLFLRHYVMMVQRHAHPRKKSLYPKQSETRKLEFVVGHFLDEGLLIFHYIYRFHIIQANWKINECNRDYSTQTINSTVWPYRPVTMKKKHQSVLLSLVLKKKICFAFY